MLTGQCVSIAHPGFFRGYFAGVFATLPAQGCYFATYEYTKQKLTDAARKRNSKDARFTGAISQFNAKETGVSAIDAPACTAGHSKLTCMRIHRHSVLRFWRALRVSHGSRAGRKCAIRSGSGCSAAFADHEWKHGSRQKSCFWLV
jgi:hypothetical protein